MLAKVPIVPPALERIASVTICASKSQHIIILTPRNIMKERTWTAIQPFTRTFVALSSLNPRCSYTPVLSAAAPPEPNHWLCIVLLSSESRRLSSYPASIRCSISAMFPSIPLT